MTTPEEGLAAIDARFGVARPPPRAARQGRDLHGDLHRHPRGRELTRAGHMSGEPVPTTTRLSNGGGDPTEPDYAPDVRGLAVAFHLPDGTRTDILAQTLPHYPFPDERGFLAALAISKPSPSALLEAARASRSATRGRSPRCRRRTGSSTAAPASPPAATTRSTPTSGSTPTAASATSATPGCRPSTSPTSPRPRPSAAAPTTCSTTSPSGSRASRCGCELEVQIAGDGDDVDDPSSIWPDERERGDRRHARDHRDRPRTPTTRSSWTRCGSSTGSSPPATRCSHYRPPVYDLSLRAPHRRHVASLADEGRARPRRGRRPGRRLADRRARRARRRRTGWDPATADVVVGTSAGSVIGSLCVAGIPPWFMVAHSAGETFEGVVDARGRPAAEADRSGGARFRLERGLAADRPRLVAARAAHPARAAPLPARRRVRRLGAARLHLDRAARRRSSAASSRRLDRPSRTTGSSPATTRPAAGSPFGREGAPQAELADAVAASCAIPGFYHPVEIGGRRYVDGGIYSTSNLDLVRDQRARPRHLPQPDLVAAPGARLEPARAARHA